MTDAPTEIKTGDTIVKADGEDLRSEPGDFRSHDHWVYTPDGTFDAEATKENERAAVERRYLRQASRGRRHFCKMVTIPDTPPANRQQRRALERSMAKFARRNNGPCHPERQIKPNGAKWRKLVSALAKSS